MSGLERLVIATSNKGKVPEVRALLPAGARVETLADHPSIAMPEETGATFEENAMLKAEHVARALGVPVLADDSGLVVDALGGAPGVKSARYAEGSDADRTAKLLRALEGVPRDRRTARFVCAVALAIPGEETRVARGEVEGRIGDAPRGGHGFGYDPVFLVERGERTMAELTLEEKSRVSHRARALTRLFGARPS